MNDRRLLVSLCFLTLPVSAQVAPKAGFSGEISINMGVASSTSNLNTSGSDTINSLNQSASSDTGFILAPLGTLTYTFGSNLNQQLYGGTSRDDIAVGTLAFELGYRYRFQSGTSVDISYLPTIVSGEEWADPYLLNAPRKETDVDGNAYRLQISRLAGLPIKLDLAYADKDVDNDEYVGTELARDAKTWYMKGQYILSLSKQSTLAPALTYTDHSADGNATSFDEVGVELSWFTAIERNRLALTAGYSKRDYDQGAQLFDHVARSEDVISLFAAFERPNIMGWKNWSLISLAGYGQSNSNLTFYDESQYIVSVGMNYRF